MVDARCGPVLTKKKKKKKKKKSSEIIWGSDIEQPCELVNLVWGLLLFQYCAQWYSLLFYKSFANYFLLV